MGHPHVPSRQIREYGQIGDYYFDKDQGRAAAAAVGTNAGAAATIAASATYKWLPVGIQASGDAAALVTIESPSGTVLWRKRFAAAFTFSDAFLEGTIVGANDAAVVFKISASTSNCEVNGQAFKIKD